MCHSGGVSLRAPAGILAVAVLFVGATAPGLGAAQRDLGREVLAPNDGWASFGTGTTGGADATPEQTWVVRTRRELIAALNNGVYPGTSNPSNAPKIIYVDGTIDANADDNDAPLTCADYERDGYTLEAYLATYDPSVCGPRRARSSRASASASARTPRSSAWTATP
jgi:pectate lyase